MSRNALVVSLIVLMAATLAACNKAPTAPSTSPPPDRPSRPDTWAVAIRGTLGAARGSGIQLPKHPEGLPTKVSVFILHTPRPPEGALEIYLFESREDEQQCAFNGVCRNFVAAHTDMAAHPKTLEGETRDSDLWLALRNTGNVDLTLDGQALFQTQR